MKMIEKLTLLFPPFHNLNQYMSAHLHMSASITIAANHTRHPGVGKKKGRIKCGLLWIAMCQLSLVVVVNEPGASA